MSTMTEDGVYIASISEFVEDVKFGTFTDYDGGGYYGTEKECDRYSPARLRYEIFSCSLV